MIVPSTREEMSRLGYYAVSGKPYFRKLEALEASAKAWQPISFHYQDEFWAAQDWTTAPLESLDELYCRRIQQLRNKYDYIVLCFSGGADSGNVLRRFDRHGVHLDEIAMWHDYSLSRSWESLTSKEVAEIAVPIAEGYVDRHPATVLTVFDIREPMLELVARMTPEDHLHTFLSSKPTISAAVRGGGWFYLEPRYRKLVEQGKRVCLLWGMDKTLIRGCSRKSYTFSFSDLWLRRNRKALMWPELPVYDEAFYHSADCPELVIKQCHVLKENMDALPEDYVDPAIDIEGAGVVEHETICTKRNALVSLETVNHWLYGWTPPMTVGKSFLAKAGRFVSALDGWVYGHLREDAVVKWVKAIKEFEALSRRMRAAPVMSGRFYAIEKVEPTRIERVA